MNFCKKFRIILLVSMVMLTAHAAMGAESGIRIGASLSMTGKYEQTGIYTKNGYELWADNVNARGGLLGRQVELIIYDDQSDPKKAVELYEKLITADKVDLLMGPYSSRIVFAVAELTEKHNFPMVTAGASSEEIWNQGHRYLFGTGPHNEQYYIGAFEMIKQKGFKTVGIIYADDLFPLSLAKAVTKLSKKNSTEIIFSESYPKGNQDFAPIISKVKATHPDVLFGATYLPDSVMVARELKAQNCLPKMVVLSVGPSSPDFVEQLGDDADYFMGESYWEPSVNTPGNKEFIENYRKKFGHEPEYHSAWGYTGCQVLEAAVKEAGSCDREKVREALKKISDFNIAALLPGVYKVDEQGMQSGHITMIVQCLNKKREIIWPDQYKTAEPVLPVPAWDKRK